MKLINILAIVATVADKRDFKEISSIEGERLADIAKDICVVRKKNRLSFHKVDKKGSRITKTLLDSDLNVAPFIVFTHTNTTNKWVAEEFNLEVDFDRYLNFNKSIDSVRIAIIGANKVINKPSFEIANVSVDRGTSLVNLT